MTMLVRSVLARRKAVLWATLALSAVSGVLGSTVISSLSPGGFIDDRTGSARADQVLAREFRTGTSTLVLLVTDPRGVDAPAVQQASTALTRRLAGEPGVSQVVSYWNTGGMAALRSEDGRKALILAAPEGDEREVAERMEHLTPAYSGTQHGVDVKLGGPARANQEMIETTEKDLVRAEAFAFPLVLLALVVVFGGAISVLATNVTTGLRLGLSIDYSLFIISRYREELRRGAGTQQAITIAMRTAGRTVLFSALTVALALSALLVFPFYFLRSFAYAGIPTALVAAAAALIPPPRPPGRARAAHREAAHPAELPGAASRHRVLVPAGHDGHALPRSRPYPVRRDPRAPWCALPAPADEPGR